MRFGGFILSDDAEPSDKNGFTKSLSRELSAILPENSLRKLNKKHSVFRSFFLVAPEKSVGRLANYPFVEGISFQDWTPLVHTRNDLGGALARTPFGEWKFDCS